MELGYKVDSQQVSSTIICQGLTFSLGDIQMSVSIDLFLGTANFSREEGPNFLLCQHKSSKYLATSILGMWRLRDGQGAMGSDILVYAFLISHLLFSLRQIAPAHHYVRYPQIQILKDSISLEKPSCLHKGLEGAS